MGWLKARTQRKYLKECLTQIGKLDKKTDEEKITTLYIERKITDSDRQLLNDKIAEYYNNTNGSDGSPIK